MKVILALATLWAHCAVAISGDDLFAMPLSNAIADNTELFEQIDASISDSRDSAKSALDTLMKRQGQCPGGSYSCGDGTCCWTGYACVPGYCCPNRTPSVCSSSLRTCYNPSTQICCNDGRNCPRGYDCVSGGRCCPSGTIPCGSRYCYAPRTQTCCANGGVCSNDQKCCGSYCCRESGYCASGNTCELCPARTVSARPSTWSRTTYIYKTTTTSSAPTGAAPTFSCPTMTATNEVGDTLALRRDCGLQYSPEETTSAARALVRAADAPVETSGPSAEAAELRPRQDCVPWTTWTTTPVTTVTVSVTSTYTRAGSISSQGFSCPAMEVTNADGDRLSMNTGCSLSFKPATSDRNIQADPPTGVNFPPAETDEPDSTPDSPNIDTPGGAPTPPDNSGSVIGPRWEMWALASAVCLWGLRL